MTPEERGRRIAERIYVVAGARIDCEWLHEVVVTPIIEECRQEVRKIFESSPKEYGHGKKYQEGYRNALLEANEAIRALKRDTKPEKD